MASESRAIDADRLSLISRMSMAVGEIPKNDIQETKAYANPPIAVIDVMKAALILLGIKDTDWSNSKKILGSLNAFTQQVQGLDPEKVSSEQCGAANQILQKYTRDQVKNASKAIVTIFDWCVAVAQD